VIGERSLASMAISNGRIFIRTDDNLFCVGAGAGRPASTGPRPPL
jgi:hypothetical protein